MKYLRALFYRFFPPRFDPLTGGEDAYIVRNTDALPEALNDADLARIRVKSGGTPGKLNYKRSDPHHPKHREYLEHERNKSDIPALRGDSEASCALRSGSKKP